MSNIQGGRRCGKAMHVIGEERSEHLDKIPGTNVCAVRSAPCERPRLKANLRQRQVAQELRLLNDPGGGVRNANAFEGSAGGA